MDCVVPPRAYDSLANTTGGIRCRPPTPSDGRALWQLARSVGLDLNSPYAYVLWSDYFSKSSTIAVATQDDPGSSAGVKSSADNDVGTVVGFITGFHPPADPTTLFVWQVGVAVEARGRGLGRQMLDELLARSGARWLEATVTPSNTASIALFRGTASRHGTGVDETLAYPRELFPGDHEPEVRFRIGPFTGSTVP